MVLRAAKIAKGSSGSRNPAVPKAHGPSPASLAMAATGRKPLTKVGSSHSVRRCAPKHPGRSKARTFREDAPEATLRLARSSSRPPISAATGGRQRCSAVMPSRGYFRVRARTLGEETGRPAAHGFAQRVAVRCAVACASGPPRARDAARAASLRMIRRIAGRARKSHVLQQVGGTRRLRAKARGGRGEANRGGKTAGSTNALGHPPMKVLWTASTHRGHASMGASSLGWCRARSREKRERDGKRCQRQGAPEASARRDAKRGRQRLLSRPFG